jgi:hypothetical protein
MADVRHRIAEAAIKMSDQPNQFQSATSTQTLDEALAEYYAANPQLKRGDALSAEAKSFFLSHDVVHVLYGCGTSMPEEAVVKLSSLFGTTGGFAILRGYRLHESLDIYRKLPIGSTLVALAASPYITVRTLWRCAHQRARWPWSNFGEHMQTPLRELRAQFGIKVAHESNTSAA